MNRNILLLLSFVCLLNFAWSQGQVEPLTSDDFDASEFHTEGVEVNVEIEIIISEGETDGDNGEVFEEGESGAEESVWEELEEGSDQEDKIEVEVVINIDINML